MTAPKYDQVKNIAFKALGEHLRRLKNRNPGLYGAHFGDRNVLRTIVRFRNGSQILAESPMPDTIRGHTAKVIYLMECNFIRDDEDLYTAVLFTLNTTNGYLIAESTPWNTDSVFYRMFHEWRDEPFSTHMVTYEEALPPRGPLSPGIVETIRKQLQGDPARWKREMLCEWTEDTDTWLTTSLITLAQDNGIDYVDLDAGLRGDFYVGADFGKKRDYSVVAVTEARGAHKILRHLHRFPLETPYGAVIGYMKRLQDGWSVIRAVYADKTGVGDYIVEDMQRGGLLNVTGVNFTDTSKEAMATALKENMRRADCPSCGWSGYIEDIDSQWRTTCPEGCRSINDQPIGLRPMLHIPYDPDLFAELNVERFELSKSGKILFNHPEGTNDDRFWALAFSVYAAEMSPPSASRPIGKII